MNGKVSHHAGIHKLTLNKLADQLLLLVWIQLDWQGHHHLAGDLRIPALLGVLYGVPELAPVVNPLGGISWGHDLSVINALLLAVVELQPSTFIGDGITSPVSSRPGRTASGGSADDLGAEVIDRHGAGILAPQAAHIA